MCRHRQGHPCRYIREDVWIVCKRENNGIGRNIFQCSRYRVFRLPIVTNASQPQVWSLLVWQRDRLVIKDWYACALKGTGYTRSIKPPVVVTKNCVNAERSLQVLQDRSD